MKINSLLRTLFVLLGVSLPLLAMPVKAQTVSNELPIQFGEIVVGGSSTVTVNANTGLRSSTGSVALVGTSPVTRGSALITYTPGAQVIITLPGSLTMSGANAPTLTPILQGSNVQTIPVGGTLTIYFGATMTFTTSGATGPASVTIPVNVDPF